MTNANFGDRPRVEPGTIIMWAGDPSNVPSGWMICDGVNDTPNLVNRFIKGTPSAGSSTGYTAGQGAYRVTEAKMTPHAHSGTTDTGGAHAHELPYIDYDDGYSDYEVDGGLSDYPDLFETEANGAHSHTFETDSTGSDETVNNRPAYYELTFIMKT